ncbi:MAG: arylsulfotransferase family protein [Thermoleophilia bacterium]|nr:arylsulfotransferase family protein [Thermoleophilia bacterium]
MRSGPPGRNFHYQPDVYSSDGSPRIRKLALPAIALAITLTAFSSSAAEARTARATVTPGPTAENASVYSEISFRGVNRSKAGHISVHGSRSGGHAFSRRGHSDGAGFSLVMKRPFETSERVIVKTRLRIPGTKGGNYKFKVENLGGPRVKRLGNAPLEAGGDVQFKSRPDLRPFTLQVRKNTGAAGHDPIFVGSKQRGSVIFDSNGKPVWFKPMRSTDFRTQKYKGKPALTWFESPTEGSGIDRATLTIANRKYRVIKQFTPGNGYAADSHEFRLTSRNTAYVTTYRTVKRNLRPIGFDKNGRVSDSIAQEVDLRTGRVIWEWHSLDHVPVKQSYANGPRRPGNPYDYFHINSIIDTPDGNVMISGRSTNAIYKISRSTGRIIWTLGGKKSDYRFGRGAAFSFQHDAEPHSGNTISLFDNADAPIADHPFADQSRAIVLKLDNRKKKATLVREFLHPQKPLSPTQANIELLGSGNWFICWGQFPFISEYTPDGDLVFDSLIRGASSVYRAYRQPWTGRPAGKVAIAVTSSDGTSNAWVSWNGDTEVRSWKSFTGPSAAALTPSDTTTRTGFETRLALPSGAAFVQVQGLDADGKTIGSTAVTRAN